MKVSRKQNFFNIGFKASSNYIVDEAPGYICPTCLDIFYEINDLTKEHVPPDSLGGKILCLTCKNCNNRSGHTIDAAVHERVEMAEIFLKGTNRRLVQLKIDDLVVNAKINQSGGFSDFVIDNKINDPNKLLKFLELTREPSKHQKAEIEIQYKNKYTEDEALVGLLRIAYLYAFVKFGYAYIIRDCLDPIRLQIANPKEKIIWKWWLQQKENTSSHMLYCFDSPINCLMVTLGEYGIVLPAFDEPYNQYERIKALTEGTSENHLVGKFHIKYIFPPPTTMELLFDPK